MVGLFCFIHFANAKSGSYITDPSKLKTEEQIEYKKIVTTLEDIKWEHEALQELGIRIDGFIKSEQNFLPIYIEKVRFYLIYGYYVNQYKEYNIKALNIIHDLIRKEPDYPKAYVLGGHIYSNLGDINNAVRYLKKAESLGTDDPWLYLNFAVVYEKSSQYNKALSSALQGLIYSTDNSDTLLAAIDLISKYSNKLNISTNNETMSDIVFDHVKDPYVRIRIAKRLSDAYSGRKEMLYYSYQIVKRQKELTPNFAFADLVMADLVMKDGFIIENDFRQEYMPGSLERAEIILENIKDDKSVRTEAFEMQFNILFHQKKYIAAREHLNKSKIFKMPENTESYYRAKLAYVARMYPKTIRILEKLGEQDPAYENDRLLLSAYGKLGDYTKLNDYHLRQIEKQPTNAWVYGNYASFLLTKMDDIDGAIQHGEKALEIMQYPHARNITGIAYIYKSTKAYNNGDHENARKYYLKGLSYGVTQEYINKHCYEYCAGIKKVQNILDPGV